MIRLVHLLTSAAAASAVAAVAVCGPAAIAAPDSTNPGRDVIAHGRGFDWDPSSGS